MIGRSLWCRAMMFLLTLRLLTSDQYNVLIDIPCWLKHPVAMWHWTRHSQDESARILGNINAGEYLEAFHCECGAYFLHPFGAERDSHPLLQHPNITAEQRRSVLNGQGVG